MTILQMWNKKVVAYTPQEAAAVRRKIVELLKTTPLCPPLNSPPLNIEDQRKRATDGERTDLA